ncbi:MAG: autotransporter domain-containing protein [Fusobacteriaceae bacterium]|nr:autotransporter domain-containing protein [Fusobacteriaceae bacterium]
MATNVGVIDDSLSVDKLKEIKGGITIVDIDGIDKKSLTREELQGELSHGEIVSLIVGASTYGGSDDLSIVGINHTIKDSNGKIVIVSSSEMYLKLDAQNVKIINCSFGAHLDKLLEEGVQVPHNTWSKYTKSDITSWHGNEIAAWKTIINKEDPVLIIWAAGNQPADYPTFQALMPKYFTELERGWLAVTAVDSEDTTRLGTKNNGSRYASALGDAAYWGMAAIGDIIIDLTEIEWAKDVFEDGDLDRNPRLVGTSFAAPRVAKVAGEIANKYPWMTADIIRMTLLSTADNIVVAGEDYKTGVDSTFGWGLLNEDRALGGPAGFWKELAFDEDGNKTDTITITIDDKQVPNIFTPNVYMPGQFSDTITKASEGFVFSNDIIGDVNFTLQGTGTQSWKGALILAQPQYWVYGKLNLDLRQGSGTAGSVTLTKGANLIFSNGIACKKITIDGSNSNLFSLPVTPLYYNITTSGNKEWYFDEDYLDYTMNGNIDNIGRGHYTRVYGNIENNGGNFFVSVGGTGVSGDIIVKNNGTLWLDLDAPETNFGIITDYYHQLNPDENFNTGTDETILEAENIDLSDGQLHLMLRSTDNLLASSTMQTKIVLKAHRIIPPVGFAGTNHTIDVYGKGFTTSVWTGDPIPYVNAWIKYYSKQYFSIKYNETYDVAEVSYQKNASAPTMASVLSYVPASIASAGEAFDAMLDAQANVEEDSAFKTALADILYSPAAALPGAWAGLAGEVYSVVKNITFKQSKIMSKQLSNRLYSIATEEGKASAGVWFDYINAKGKIYDHGHTAADTKINGAQFGVDFPVTENLKLGIALSGYKSEADLSANYGGTAKGVNISLSGYGIYNFPKLKGLYALGRLGVGLYYTEIDRTTGSGARVKPKTVDVGLSAYGELGYSIPLADRYKITPFLGIQADFLRGGGFTEHDPTLGLIVDDSLYSQTSGVLGLRAEAKFNRFKFNAHIAHLAAFNDEKLKIQTRYAGDPTKRKYEIDGIGLSRNTTWIGLGADFAVKENFTINLNYDTSIEDGKTTDRAISLGFRYKF